MSKIDRQRSRLGRGLSTLLTPSTADPLPVMRELPQAGAADQNAGDPTNTSSDAAREVFRNISVAQIRPNPHQPRRQLNAATIAELSASIRATGVIQPIIVRAIVDGFELIAGERRWRATQMAGLETIPAIIRQAEPAAQAQMALVENIQREDLNPIDRAASYRTLMDQLGLTQAELADRLGEERSGIANYVRLLNLAEPVRALVRDRDLSLGHAKLLAGVEDILEQQRLADLVVANELSVRNLERMIQSPETVVPARQAAAVPSAHLRDLEATLTTQLGMRINVRSVGRKGAGKLTIHYADLDQFDEVVRKLGGKLSDI